MGNSGVLGKQNYECSPWVSKNLGYKNQTKVLVYVLTKKQHKSDNKKSKFVA